MYAPLFNDPIFKTVMLFIKDMKEQKVKIVKLGMSKDEQRRLLATMMTADQLKKSKKIISEIHGIPVVESNNLQATVEIPYLKPGILE